MSLPIDRTTKAALDTNLVNGNTSDAPVIKNSNDVVYNTIDELYNYINGFVAGGTLQPYPFALYRQALINAGFDVWQRGTSFSTNGYTADRWNHFQDGSGSVYTISQQLFTLGQTAVPNEPKYYLRHQCTTAPTGQTNNSIHQKIESVRSFAGKTITVSFYAKADIARSLVLNFWQVFGTGGTPSTSLNTSSTTFSLTTSWQRFTKTIAVPSISGKILGTNNDDCSWIELLFPNNATFIIDIAQVQVNAGDQALPFQPKSFADELALCQRYYEKSYDYATAPATASTSPGIESKVVPSNTIAVVQPYGKVNYKTAKRIIGTITIYPFTTPTNTGRVSTNGGTDLAANSAGVTYSGISGFTAYNNSGVVLTTTESAVLFHWATDSEL